MIGPKLWPLLWLAVLVLPAGSQTLTPAIERGVMRRAEFHVSPVGKPILRIDCAQVGVCGEIPTANYAYAPADIVFRGVRHIYFCSGGIPNVTFDSIRYINDRNRILDVALTVRGGGGTGSDMAACDPSVVMFGGYVYLFYGSAAVLNAQNADRLQWKYINVVHVARAPAFEGPFAILDEDGSWKSATDTPKEIVAPAVRSLERSQSTGYLGASWPSAVIVNGKMRLWYSDDTDRDPNKPKIHPYYYKESSDGSSWSPPVRTDISDVVHSAEVKYDSSTGLFVMFSVYGASTESSWLGIRSSSDGIGWREVEKVVDLPGFSHNVGVESDEHGYLSDGTFEFSFGAPIGLLHDVSPGRWSLYTGKLKRLGSP